MRFEPYVKHKCHELKANIYYDYDDMVNIIEDKYKFKVRDYHDFKFPNLNKIDRPFMDFWHFMIDEYFTDIRNGSLCHLNWQEVHDIAKEEWQQEIITYFIKEFGTQNFMVHIYW